MIDLNVMSKISYEFAKNNLVLPISGDSKTVTVKSNECTRSTIDYLQVIFGKRIIIQKCSKEELIKEINEKYKRFIYKSIDNDNNKLAEEIIKLAVRERASDIHFESYDDECIIRFRIDGILYTKFKMSHKDFSSLLNKLKFMANMDIADKILPQDGKIKFKYDDIDNIDLRASSIPTVSGEKLVIRILFKNDNLLEISNMCYTEKQKRLMEKFIDIREGLIIICGPTGSGKSTTLYAMLNKEDSSRLNITTIEDPAEFLMKNINQININEKIDFTFSKAIKHVLRQDPDIIMLGEIRDEDTAENAIRAAITGHKVYTTLHTNSILNVPGRLKDMRVKCYLLKDCLKGVISQRLVRKLCPYCKKERKEIDKQYKIKRAYDASGCEKCTDGYLGRIVLYEMAYITSENKEAFFNGNFEEKQLFMDFKECLNEYVEKGYISYADYKKYLLLYCEG